MTQNHTNSDNDKFLDDIVDFHLSIKERKKDVKYKDSTKIGVKKHIRNISKEMLKAYIEENERYLKENDLIDNTMKPELKNKVEAIQDALRGAGVKFATVDNILDFCVEKTKEVYVNVESGELDTVKLLKECADHIREEKEPNFEPIDL